MTETIITGRLENWTYDLVWKVLLGDIYEDTKGRFQDGLWIHTSVLKHTKEEIKAFKEGDVVTTKYSTYLLGKKGAVQPKEED